MCQSKTLRGSESHGAKVSRLFPFHPLVGLSSEPLKVVMSAKPEDSCSRIFGEEEEEDLLVLTHHHKQIKLFLFASGISGTQYDLSTKWRSEHV